MIMRVNECFSETKKNWSRECYLETRQGPLRPEVKAANEVACDFVWDKLYTTPPFL
jgi:hypothetical protein